jgi:threonine dehydratase
MTPQRPGLDDIRAARQRLRGLVVETPVLRSQLPGPAGPVWLKLECLQPSGAFKLRGAVNAIRQLEPGGPGVVCCSTGNHGLAVAQAARALGVPATVCLSSLVPEAKARAVAAAGATLRRCGASQDEAQAEADRLVAAARLVDIPPFDHPAVIAGQGTLALELLEQVGDLDCLLVPLSGGGLAAGVALAAKALRPGLRVIGVSMERGAAMAAALAAGRPVPVTEVASLADSLGGGIGAANRLTFALCRDLLDDVVLVREEEIYRGMQALYWEDRLVTEGAAAVGPAALLAGKVAPRGPVACIVSGRNVDMGQFTRVVTGQGVRLGDLEVKGDRYG